MLACHDLILGYEGTPVVEHLSFEVESGSYLCIVGENGAGKSTLMKAILGLQKPMGGEVIMSDGLSNLTLGYLPQQTPVQKDFPATVEEIVLSGNIGKQWRMFYTAEEKKRATDAMKQTDVLDLAKRSYRTLSGGQQQRVLLARALTRPCKALFLDEPIAGLDPVATAQMYEIIRRLNRDGVMIVMISHDVHDALNDASHVLHLGKETFFGTRQDYLKTADGQAFAQGEDTHA